jgi:hypothetical protein
VRVEHIGDATRYCMQPTMTRNHCQQPVTHITPLGMHVCEMHAREIAIVFYSSRGSMEPCFPIGMRR